MNTLDESLIIDNFSVNNRIASLPKRFGASLIDFGIITFIGVLEYFWSTTHESASASIGLFTVIVAYKPLMESEIGATLGKLAVGTKVVQEDGKKIDLKKAIIRYIPWLILLTISIFSTYFINIFYPADTGTLIDLITILEREQKTFYLEILGYAIFLISTGALLFDNRHQGLHDRAARTLVVDKKD